MPLFKIWSGDRDVRKVVLADSYGSLVDKGNFILILLFCYF